MYAASKYQFVGFEEVGETTPPTYQLDQNRTIQAIVDEVHPREHKGFRVRTIEPEATRDYTGRAKSRFIGREGNIGVEMTNRLKARLVGQVTSLVLGIFSGLFFYSRDMIGNSLFRGVASVGIGFITFSLGGVATTMGTANMDDGADLRYRNIADPA